jgi:hypothetical protein
LDEQKEKILGGKPIAPEHFAEWKDHPITRLLRLELSSKQLEAAQEIIEKPQQDNSVNRGFIEVAELMLEWKPEGLEDE